MKIKPPILFVLLFIIASCLLTSCFKNLAKETVVYENNFENNNTDKFEIYGWLNGGTDFGRFESKIINFNGNKVLGSFNNNAVDFIMDSLPPHYAIRVEFDLNIHDQWKNDLWKYTIDSATQLLTGFSNDSSVMQSYPNWFGNGSSLSPAGANAYNRNLSGLCSWSSKPDGTSMYKIVNTYMHNNPSLTIIMSDANSYKNDTCRLSWSIDNFKVTLFYN